jgi:hypothetical protein
MGRHHFLGVIFIAVIQIMIGRNSCSFRFERNTRIQAKDYNFLNMLHSYVLYTVHEGN